MGVRASTIYRWQREARSRARQASQESAFTAVTVVADEPAVQLDLIIEVGQNVRLRMPAGFDTESLLRVLRLVQQC
jgi:transposase-like protein